MRPTPQPRKRLLHQCSRGRALARVNGSRKILQKTGKGNDYRLLPPHYSAIATRLPPISDPARETRECPRKGTAQNLPAEHAEERGKNGAEKGHVRFYEVGCNCEGQRERWKRENKGLMISAV